MVRRSDSGEAGIGVPLPGAARRSPPTERVVQVLDYLVARPGLRFGLSELARELELSKPTCLGILTALTDAGYLIRDPADEDLRPRPGADRRGPGRAAGIRVGTDRTPPLGCPELGVRCDVYSVGGGRRPDRDPRRGRGSRRSRGRPRG